MEAPHHTMPNLFAQLGLPSDLAAIENFIATHSPLSSELLLAEAPFWTASQAVFLREKKLEDADWAEVIEALNSALRKRYA